MKVVLKTQDQEPSLTHEDVMLCNDTGASLYDYGPFVEDDTPYIYLPADDQGNGEFWLRLDILSGMFEAFSPSNLELANNIRSIDPTLTIEY